MTDSMSVRVGSGPMGHERALARAGLGPVAGCDEAGRGACAGPLVAAAVILDDRRSGRIAGLADSKTLSAAKREALFNVIMDKALAVSWVRVEADECDRLGMQVCGSCLHRGQSGQGSHHDRYGRRDSWLRFCGAQGVRDSLTPAPSEGVRTVSSTPDELRQCATSG